MNITFPAIRNYIKEKWQHAGFQRYFKNTGWMFVGQLTMIISLIVNIWLARYLGPEKFGIINYIFAFAGIFGFIANLGINDILVRELVKNPQKKDSVLGTAFILLALGGLISFLVTAVSALIFESSNLIKVLIILYSTISLWSPINVISAYFQATVQAKKNAQAQIIGVIIVSIFKAFLILTGQGIIWLVFAFVLDYLVGTVLYIINYWRSDLNFRNWSFDKEMAKVFLSASFYLMLSAATGYLLLKIDQVMIKYYLTETQVGLYAVAVKLSEIWYFIPSIICASLFPAIINAKKTSEEIYTNRLKKLYLFLTGTALVIALPIALLAPWIIKLLYGSAYLDSTQILQIYVWSGLGYFLGVGINKFFMAENYLRSIFFYNLISVITNIILNIILIPKIGLTGAAWATLISYSMTPIIFFMMNGTKKRLDQEKIFVSVIWGYAKYFYNFAEEEHYHLHALKLAREMGYKTVVLLRAEKGVMEGDPQFNKETEIIYYSNIFSYLATIIKYSVRGAVFYVNSVEPQSLLVPFLARKTVFMGHTHPIRQTKLKQKIFNFSMKFFSKVRLTNETEKNFLVSEGLKAEKLKVVPLSLSLKDYKLLNNTEERKDLVYFGNITAKKNLPTIIKACNLVCQKYPETKLHLIGREYEKIPEDLVDPKLQIIRYGFIQEAKEVNVILNKFLIGLNSSFDEGMCVAVYNMALAGCALCLPKIMSFTDVFKNQALFHEVNDAEQLAKNIIFYLENQPAAKEHNQRCREMIIRDYNYQKVSELMRDLFTF